MRILLLSVLLGVFSYPVAQEKTETRELVGHIAKRSALLVMHATQRADGGWQLTGEYLLLPTLVRRYLEGERSPEIGVTTLKEGTTAILFGRPATGELRGTWRDGRFRGMRYGPGGQERERFEFSESFPAMDAYSASVKCEAGGGPYSSALAYSVESGQLKSLEWRSTASGQACVISGLQQQAAKGGLRFTGADCAVSLREVGDFVKVAADGCTKQCGAGAYFEPVLVDSRGNCRLLRPAN
ncbi:MAG TPA: hypothetical protein VD965_02425 [Burkholderiales bacterium]|nr:hypothetical protein [Burkholderiales bacterium]